MLYSVDLISIELLLCLCDSQSYLAISLGEHRIFLQSYANVSPHMHELLLMVSCLYARGFFTLLPFFMVIPQHL